MLELCKGKEVIRNKNRSTSCEVCSGEMSCSDLHAVLFCVLPYLEGQGDLVSRLMMGIIRITIWVIGVINLLTKSP